MGYAVPAANISLDMSRSEALQQARQFVEDQGYALDGYESAIKFHWDQGAKVYLEKELSLADANRVMAEEEGVWFWNCRWYQPGNLEEFRLWLSPKGEVVGMAHIIPEDQAGQSLTAQEAHKRATAFLEGLGIDLSNYEMQSRRSEDRPTRRDHNFTWERQNFDAKDADYRILVTILGDEVGIYQRRIHVPEEWSRDEALTRWHRDLLFRLAMLFKRVLEVASVILLFYMLRSKGIHLRHAVLFGLAVGLFEAATAANTWGTAWFDYSPNDSAAAFRGDFLVQVASQFLYNFVYVAFLAIVAQALGRSSLPRYGQVDHVTHSRYYSSQAFLTAALVGTCAIFIHSGYFATFYVLGKEYFGVWAPQRTPFTNVLSTPFPFLHPMTSGLGAALREELLYRVIAVSLVLRLTGIRWIAVVIPAIVWALAHSPYPQEPVYIRTVELTVVGVFYGYLLLRYGLVTTLISHYGYNVIVGSAVLLQSGDRTLQASGAVAVLSIFVPLLPCLWRRLSGKALLDWQPKDRKPVFLLPTDAQAPRPEAIYSPAMLMPRLRMTLIVGAAAASLLVLGVTVIWLRQASPTGGLESPHRMPALMRLARPILADDETDPGGSGGDVINVNVNRQAAERIAEDHLRGLGVDTSAYHHVANFRNALGAEDMDYVYQQVGLQRQRRLLADRFSGRCGWRVRFFKPLEAEGYLVYITAEGEVFERIHNLPDEAPGASLSQAEARSLAEAYLIDTHGQDMGLYTPVDEYSIQRPDRNDHHFEWQLDGSEEEDPQVRVRINVHGDEVSGFFPFVHVPEEWRRTRSRETTKDFAALLIAALYAIAIGSIVGMLFMVAFLRGELSFRKWWIPALALTFVHLILELNGLTTFWVRYSTVVQGEVYLWREVLRRSQQMAAIFLAYWTVFTFVAYLVRWAFPSWRPFTPWRNRVPISSLPNSSGEGTVSYSALWCEAFVIAGSAYLISLAIMALGGIVSSSMSDVLEATVYDHVPVPLVVGAGTAWSRSIALLSQGIIAGVTGATLLVSVAALYKGLVKRRRWLMALIISLAMYAGLSESQDLGEFMKTLAAVTFALTAAALLIAFFFAHFMRQNLATLGALALTHVLLGVGMQLILDPDRVAHYVGIGALAVWALSWVFCVVRWYHDRGRTTLESSA
jgi:hypothetical protein